MAFKGFNVGTAFIYLLQVILDLALTLLQQFMVLLTFKVQLLDMFCVLGYGFSEVLDFFLKMKGILICIPGVLQINDVVLGLDQLLLILLVGLTKDQYGLA